MKPTELRIGNYLYCDKAYLTRVKGVNEKEILVNTLFVESIDPIPLAEHWLLKLGFEKTKANEYFIDKPTVLGIRFNQIGKTRAIVFRTQSVEVSPICEYVHQLQNLYFALTGEELILK